MSRLPEGYLELECIETTGTQYINKFKSGEIRDPDWKLVIDFLPLMPTELGYFLTGGYSTSLKTYCLAVYCFLNDNNFKIGVFHGQSTLLFDKELPMNRITLEVLTNSTDRTVSIKYQDGEVITQNYEGTPGVDMFSPPAWQLFSSEEPSPVASEIKCYSVKLYDTKTDTILKDCIPVLRTSDNKPGLYDLKNNTYITSSSGYDFLYEYKKVNNIVIPDNPKIFNIQDDVELEAEFEDTRLPIYKGDKRVLSRYKGNRKVIEIYKGNTKIY